MFNNTYGLTQAVKKGLKTMTRRVLPLSEADEVYLDQAFDWDLREAVILDRYSQYKVGEIVAIAESYVDIWDELMLDEDWDNHRDKWDVFRHFLFNGEDHSVEAGWKNKMFVKAEVMPNKIIITDRKIEKLHDISVEDCMQEGVMSAPVTGWYYFPNLHLHRKKNNTAGPTLFERPESAYFTLCKKLRMVLNDSANPYVVAYTFNLLNK
jgi:hypothetical protein